jgi:hypothetical protein
MATLAHPSTKNAFVRALLVGILYQILLTPVQPLIEPAFVWVEVMLGVILSFLVAESAVAGWEPDYRAYRAVLATAFLGQGLPIVLYEVVTHIVLPALAR